MGCPELWADAWDLSVGDNIRGVATAHDGEWVIVLWANFVDTGTFYVYDRTTTVELFTKDIELGTGVHRQNFTADNDGNVYYYEETATNFRIWQIDLNDLSSGFETTTISNASDLDGPSWSPYDGFIYDLRRRTTPEVNLVRWSIADLTTHTTLTTHIPASAPGVSDEPVFTPDGAIWYGVTDISSESLYRYFEGIATNLAPSPSPGSGTVLPTVQNTAVYRTSSATPTKEINSSGDVTDATCVLQPAGSAVGTARVNVGANGLVSFLYPTSGGSGRYIYLGNFEEEVIAPTGGWSSMWG